MSGGEVYDSSRDHERRDDLEQGVYATDGDGAVQPVVGRSHAPLPEGGTPCVVLNCRCGRP